MLPHYVFCLYFFFALADIVPICNVKTTGIEIIIVAIIFSTIGGFLCTVHPHIFFAVSGTLLVVGKIGGIFFLP